MFLCPLTEEERLIYFGTFFDVLSIICISSLDKLHLPFIYFDSLLLSIFYYFSPLHFSLFPFFFPKKKSFSFFLDCFVRNLYLFSGKFFSFKFFFLFLISSSFIEFLQINLFNFHSCFNFFSLCFSFITFQDVTFYLFFFLYFISSKFLFVGFFFSFSVL